MATRYFKYLEIFIRILEEEEGKMPGHEEKELSSLMKRSQASGAMWLHMLLSSGFNDHRSFPFTQIRQHVGASEWTKREKEFKNPEVLKAFAAAKVKELDEYDAALEIKKEDKALVDSRKMTKEEFIANALKVPGRSCLIEGLFYKVVAWLGLQVAELRAGVAILWNNWKRRWEIGWGNNR